MESVGAFGGFVPASRDSLKRLVRRRPDSKRRRHEVSLRAELAKDRIRVTTVVPGLMRTGSHANALFKGDHRKEYSWFSLSATLPLSAMDARQDTASQLTLAFVLDS